MPKKISKKDQAHMQKLFEDGKDLQAENFFVAKYIIKPAKKMQEFISNTVTRVQSRILTAKQMNNLALTVSNTNAAYSASVRGLFNQYSSMFSRYVFGKYDITTPAIKNVIRRNTIATFNTHIQGALSQTNTTLLSGIRKQQLDMIKAKQKIDKAADFGRIARSEVNKLYETELRKITKINSGLDNMRQGKVITYRNGAQHSLTEYNEMATRTTLLNVDRDAVEVKSGSTNRRVVEYYLRDKRAVKEKRAVCNSIMHTRIKGIPMVALDQSAANILGIRTLEQAKQEDGKAFGPNCRHSIRPLSNVVYNEIEKVLFVAETEVA